MDIWSSMSNYTYRVVLVKIIQKADGNLLSHFICDDPDVEKNF